MRRSVVLFVLVLTAAPAWAGGFQVTAQSARAMGMGLATTGVAADASAIYYNPAGLAFLKKTWVAGGMLATNLEAQYTAPGGPAEEQKQSLNLLPQLYYAQPFGSTFVGVGAYTPFGLPLQWDDRDTFSGRRVSYLANIRTLNLNPTVAKRFGNIGVGVGLDWVHSKIQLERRQAQNLGALGVRDIADAKLKSDLADADGLGWNAGVMWDGGGALRVGASYRSSIDIEHEPVLTITQIPTGIPAVDAAVAAGLPPGPLDARVDIELPDSLNVGASLKIGTATTIAVEADRTGWSSFSQLAVIVPAAPPLSTTRNTNWSDTWAYRAGVETGCGSWQCRVGYYVDETPQPLADVGPVLPDADRQAVTVGLGIPFGAWMLDIGYVHVLFDDRTTPGTTTDALAGLWETTGSELAVNLRFN